MGIPKEEIARSTVNEPGSIPPETLRAALELWSQAGEAHYISLRGTSMLPLLQDGDQVLVTHKPGSIRTGDIVVFQRLDGLVAHRVLRVFVSGDKRILRTKGDHVLGLDTPIADGEVVGSVLEVQRGDRSMRLNTRAWRVAGKLVTGLMLAEAWLYHKAGSANANKSLRIPILFSRGLLWLGGIIIATCLAVFGHWQRQDETIVD
jgi:signal peptidase I